MWAFEAAGIVPDVVCVAKAIANGLPLSAIVSSATSRSDGAAAPTARRTAATRSPARRAWPSSRRSGTRASSRTRRPAVPRLTAGLGSDRRGGRADRRHPGAGPDGRRRVRPRPRDARERRRAARSADGRVRRCRPAGPHLRDQARDRALDPAARTSPRRRSPRPSRSSGRRSAASTDRRSRVDRLAAPATGHATSARAQWAGRSARAAIDGGPEPVRPAASAVLREELHHVVKPEPAVPALADAIERQLTPIAHRFTVFT